ncbi:hypothetical protein V8D89_000364 [Ganoderma adspersum]
MRLLDTLTGRFVEKDPRTTTYAILSHTWDEAEQTHQEVLKIQESYDNDGRLLSLFASIYRAIRYFLRLRFTTSHPIIADQSSRSSITSLPLEPDPSMDPHRRALAEPGAASIWYDPRLSFKIWNACAVARKNGYRYLWIDSCCIDKTSSSELSESINSMFQWYAGSAICYTFLANVPPGQDPHTARSHFRRSRWFKRGWTLQELIAPSELVFLSSDWTVIGSKRELAALVEEVSGVDREALLHQKSLNNFSVARRLSWAARRETKRREDRAYSLLGLFGLNMPTLYGEGDGALRRLQEEIMLRIPDQSLFAWGDVCAPPITLQEQSTQRLLCNVYRRGYDMSLFALILEEFSNGGKIQAVARDGVLRLLGLSGDQLGVEYASSPYGIRMELPVVPLSVYLPAARINSDGDEDDLYLAILGCETADQPGDLLGCFCCIPSSSESGVRTLYGGVATMYQGDTITDVLVRLFPLSPSTMERCRAHVQVKTVYISHRGRATDALESAHDWRHNDIRLVLPEEREAALRAHGYAVDFRTPGRDRPSIHLLTLSNDTHVVTIEYQHTLKRHGENLTMCARVAMSSSARPASEDQPDPSGVADWVDFVPWAVSLDESIVELSAAGARVLSVRLGFDFAGPSCYRLRVDILHHEAAVE